MMPLNVLYIMSDEHNPKVLGCHGHPTVRTPNLDRLAASGTRFASAYTNCPICVPARASLATGRYVHEIGYWDNALAYDGRLPGWGHRLQETGHRVTSIGKLHYRDGTDPTGFDEQIMPMHILNGIGDVLGSVRDILPVRVRSRELAEKIGPGDSPYAGYDRQITDHACRWLREEAPKYATKPWVLFVSFALPHFPFISPPEFYDLYPLDEVPLPKACRAEDRPHHPWLEALRKCHISDEGFDDDKRRIAIACYFGMCSYLDHNIGRVLAALEDAALAGNTRVIYTSDHGDNLGTRGLWGKFTMFEESAGIPMIVAGAEIPRGKLCTTPVTLVDLYQTFLDGVGEPLAETEKNLPGRSLFQIANGADDPDRVAFGEYHAAGAVSGALMVRKGRYKYIHYVGMAPSLFDLEADPEELIDLGEDPAYGAVVKGLETVLRRICDPEDVDRRAKKDQAALVERHGGREAVIQKGGFGHTPAPEGTHAGA